MGGIGLGLGPLAGLGLPKKQPPVINNTDNDK